MVSAETVAVVAGKKDNHKDIHKVDLDTEAVDTVTDTDT